MRRRHKIKGNEASTARRGRVNIQRGEKMGYELQLTGIIIAALIIAMMLVMISLPNSTYSTENYQPASLVTAQPQPPVKTTVTIVYNSTS